MAGTLCLDRTVRVCEFGISQTASVCAYWRGTQIGFIAYASLLMENTLFLDQVIELCECGSSKVETVFVC